MPSIRGSLPDLEVGYQGFVNSLISDFNTCYLEHVHISFSN